MWLPRLLLPLLLAAPSLASANKGNIFCCQSASGQSVCGDPLPHACYGREYRELSPRGTVIRVIAAPLSAEERTREEAAKRRQAQEESEREQQRRMDEALIQTYRGVEDIDQREVKALADIDTSLADIRRRQAELVEEREAIDRKIDELGADAVTEQIRRARRDAEAEHATYQRFYEAKLRERETVKARYAADRKRYAEISETRRKP